MDLKKKENTFVVPQEINQYVILKHTEFTTSFTSVFLIRTALDGVYAPSFLLIFFFYV